MTLSAWLQRVGCLAEVEEVLACCGVAYCGGGVLAPKGISSMAGSGEAGSAWAIVMAGGILSEVLVHVQAPEALRVEQKENSWDVDDMYFPSSY